MNIFILDDIVLFQQEDWTQSQVVAVTRLILIHMQLGNFWLINNLFSKIDDSASSICRVVLLRTCYSIRYRIDQYQVLLTDSRKVLNNSHPRGEKLLKGLY